MIIFEITNTEDHPVYRSLEVENSNRQYDFLRSIVADPAFNCLVRLLHNAAWKPENDGTIDRRTSLDAAERILRDGWRPPL